MQPTVYDILPFSDARDALRALWHEAFGDDDVFINTFFDIFSCTDKVHTLYAGGHLAAMLYALPMTILKDGTPLSAAYIYAVATAREYRGRGYMRRLMAHTEEKLRASGAEVAFLLPASAELRAAYARLGYGNCSRRCEEVFLALPHRNGEYSFTTIDEPQRLAAFWDCRLRALGTAVIHSSALLEMNFFNCLTQGGGVFAACRGDEICAAAFAVCEGNVPVVLDCMACSAGAEHFLLSEICRRYNVGGCRRFVAGCGGPHCMAKVLRSASDAANPLPRDIAISLMLDK